MNSARDRKRVSLSNSSLILFATVFFIVRFFTIFKSLASVFVSGLRFVPVYNGCVAFGTLLAPNFFMKLPRKSLPGELDPPFAHL